MSKPLQDPLYAGPRQGARTQFNALSPPSNNAPVFANGRLEDSPEANQNRAAVYESEKRRIVESCFVKKEDDGVATESYITHVRVIEDASYPSTPPPPDASGANKKSRVIIVAVRKTGRVRVHKARENANGTYSIGKTWALEELSSIQSYTNLIPRSNIEQTEKQWAGGTGFIVTLGKSYYWQAPTSKEKDFFIGSLVKIYRKYTGGKVPELFGFATHEVELLTGASVTPNLPSAAQIPPLAPPVLSPPPPIPASNERRPQSRQSLKSQSSDHNARAREQSRHEQTPPARDAQRPPPIEPLRSPARYEELQQSRDNKSEHSFDGENRPKNVEQPYTTPSYLKSSNIYASSSPQSSQHSIINDRANTRPPNGVFRPPHAPFAEGQQSIASSTQSIGSRPSTAVSDQRSFEPKPDIMIGPIEPPSERKTAPSGRLDNHLAPLPGVGSETNSQFATPAASPSDMRDAVKADLPTGNDGVDIRNPNSPQDKDYFNQNNNVVGGNETLVRSTENVFSAHNQSTVASVESGPAVVEPEPSSKKAEEEHRPGLGPMIKKKSAKDIAGQFRRAAMAANAFQPRQGGAGARLKALQDGNKVSNEPDGITSVVPAPLFRGMSSDTTKSSAPTTPTVAVKQEQTGSPATIDIPQPQILRTTTEDSIVVLETPHEQPVVVEAVPLKSELRTVTPIKARSSSPQRKKLQRQEAEISRYCSVLGIDASLLKGRGGQYNDLLTEFDWHGKPLNTFVVDVKREIGRAQATGWLGHVEQQEGKVQDLAKAFDKAIEECEELDGLFTLYSHELDTLSTDIEYIEAQSQGLQVQTANQKLLQNELNNLLKTLTISSSDLRGLQMGSLDTETGVETVEKSLALLYQALITIDPDIRQNRMRQAVSSHPDRGGLGVYADTEIGQMRAVTEKKTQYKEATMIFVQRFNLHMKAMFKGVDDKTLPEYRQHLWKYNAMMLFVREVNSYEWQTLITSYEITLKSIYQTQFRDKAMNQRRSARKPTIDDLDALFTTQEKEKPEETLATTAARKLTVKRGKTLKAGALKSQLGERKEGGLDAYEVFAVVLKDQGASIAEEQNFVVSWFHLHSQASADFTEIISSRSFDRRKLPNLHGKQSYDPDRNMAKIVGVAVEGIYSFWLSDLQNLLDWVLSIDSLQGVGVLTALEKCLAIYEETNQEFITRTLRTLHERLTGLFNKFVDEQIKAIEETKLKLKKRRGTISFMRTFPLFSTTIEQMIPAEMSSSDMLEVRFIVNDAYSKILKAMWEALSFIAKDNPAAGGTHSTVPVGGDPEDKEALNYHILLIENMNHYLEEVETLKNIVLEEWAEKAREDFLTHLTQYTESIIRRPLGKWLDFLESTEAMMKNVDAGSLSGKPSHSRSTAKKVLSSHDGKEIKKGIETLKKRIEKHFGDADDPNAGSKSLITRVHEECNIRYAGAYDRMQFIINKLYEGNLEIDWRKDEVSAIFKR